MLVLEGPAIIVERPVSPNRKNNEAADARR